MFFNVLLSFTVLAGMLLAPFQLLPVKAHGPQPQPIPAQTAPERYRPGAVLVGLRPEAAKNGRSALAAEGLEVTHEIPALGVVAVAVPEGAEIATVARLSRRSEVAFAELDYVATAQTVPNDPDYGKQWGLAQIGAPQAWAVTTGASNVVIAVIDSGIALQHPDLALKLWQNPSEVQPNGKDDDGNGYVDDGYGWHFFNSGSGNRFVQDDNGHGTHVAGIAAAATDNGAGVAGVSWRSPIMTVKVLDAYGNAFYSDIAAGILYAVNNGASILNLSLGGVSASDTLCNAVASAVSQGKLVVAAAGNTDKGSSVLYPAMCPGALAVAATDRSDVRASFSIPGSRVDLAAPGDDIWSTWYYAGSQAHTYLAQDGTSAAAPFVSGVAALVWARWPALSAAGVKAQIVGTVKDVGAPGKDDATGWGRLDAAAAVAAPVADVDLRVQAGVAPQTVVAGNPLTATFTINNAGTNAATSVTLHAHLPAEPPADGVQSGPATCSLAGAELTCGLTRLAAESSVAIRVTLTPTQVGTGELTITASVTSAQRELTPADNQQTVQSAIRPVLAGRVFLDGNGDGIRQAWETRGLAGADLIVYQNEQPVAYQPSQPPDGAYSFDALAVGAYVLRLEQLPTGYTLTTPREIAVVIKPEQAEEVYFGAWTGVAEPTPTATPTGSPTPTLTPTATASATPTATPTGRRALTYLPLILKP